MKTSKEGNYRNPQVLITKFIESIYYSTRGLQGTISLSCFIIIFQIAKENQHTTGVHD